MQSQLDIKTALKLISNKNTTIAEFCVFLFADIQLYQQERENYYLNDLKEEFGDRNVRLTEKVLADRAALICKKIEQDVKIFSLNYANDSIDAVLDAINTKQIKSKKKAYELIELLMTFKDINSK